MMLATVLEFTFFLGGLLLETEIKARSRAT